MMCDDNIKMWIAFQIYNKLACSPHVFPPTEEQFSGQETLQISDV